MGTYDALIAKAKQLIAAKGAVCTLERYIDDNTTAPGDPQSVENATDSPIESSINFVHFPAKGGEPGDEDGLVSPLDLSGVGDILAGYIIVFRPDEQDEERWQVVQATKLAPSNETIVWKVRVRLWPATTK